MRIPEESNPVARDIAQALVDGFDKHYSLFRASSARSRAWFEEGDWAGMQQGIRDRIQFYDDRVEETIQRLRTEFHADLLDDDIWQQAKFNYIGLLTNHRQPELAETFFNSVFCRVLHRDYFNNDFIFVRPAISTEYLESDPHPRVGRAARLPGFCRDMGAGRAAGSRPQMKMADRRSAMGRIANCRK